MTLGLPAEDLLAPQRQLQKQWRLDNPEKVREYYMRHQAREEHRERVRAWHATHRSQINEQARARYRRRVRSLSDE